MICCKHNGFSWKYSNFIKQWKYQIVSPLTTMLKAISNSFLSIMLQKLSTIFFPHILIFQAPLSEITIRIKIQNGFHNKQMQLHGSNNRWKTQSTKLDNLIAKQLSGGWQSEIPRGQKFPKLLMKFKFCEVVFKHLVNAPTIHNVKFLLIPTVKNQQSFLWNKDFLPSDL